MAVVLALSGCATPPPGAEFPKKSSTAFEHPEQTRIGHQIAGAAAQHDGESGFRVINRGSDGFVLRMEMIQEAERTLDLQYYIFHRDDTGRLLTGAVLRAADRGVRIRILLDDAETEHGDEKIDLLAAHPSIELRIFNPFRYRGHSGAVRGLEFLFNARRLDYRMHNKLMVVDNAMALVGGRNIGDEYFQMNPKQQFADDDVFATGPVVRPLSRTFDLYWNSALAIPIQALSGRISRSALDQEQHEVDDHTRRAITNDADNLNRVATGAPLKGLLSGEVPLIWAQAQVLCDDPEKKEADEGKMVGNLMRREVVQAARAVRSELLMITPYLVPGPEGMRMIEELRARNVRIRVLTNSLEAAEHAIAQAGYSHYRKRLLQDGVELYEARAFLGNTRGSGETAAIARYGNYSLHAKLFVFDRERVFIGSMNFDQRSMHLNTEVGLIIDSAELAEQAGRRFDAMVEPDNAYQVALSTNGHAEPTLQWLTRKNGTMVTLDREPARSSWQRYKVHVLSLLPADDEL